MRKFAAETPCICLIFCIVASSCSWFHAKSTEHHTPVKFVKEGRIVNSSRLKEGGKIIIIPFTAGSGVEETSQLNKISLMVIKGFHDAIADSAGALQVLDPDQVSEADFIIQGHITDVDKTSTMLILKNKKKLGVQGKMLDARTRQTVVLFEDFKQTDKKGEDYKHLGYVIGGDIGRFVLSGLE